ncbi:type II secretion system protein GspM [Ideonella sp.]|uniref:type II secretion system protein GspM n=1 Tax=Ideonella sp. TaxID=1929293 RepID=UPI0035B4485D
MATRLDTQDLQRRWAAMSPRERGLVALAGVAVAALLLWYVALRPAWATWRTAPAQVRTLEADRLRMQRLAAEARELKAQPPVSAAQATEALKAATERLGANAKLSQLGERATLTLTGVTAEQLRSWLADARSGARARPLDMQLTRGENGLSGQIVVALGGAS